MRRYLCIGSVVKPQGVRGEFKLQSLVDDFVCLENIERVLLKRGDEDYSSYDVNTIRASGNFIYISVQGVDDMNAAEHLRGMDVYVDRDEIDDLPKGVYYIVDIIGCAVQDEDGNKIGTVTDVLQNPGGDVYVVSGEKEIMFPALSDVFVSVDIDGKLIVVDSKRFGEVAVVED